MTGRDDSQGPPCASQPGEALDITVLMGGPSDEREVSLMSGRAVADALARCGHRVTCADITPQDCSALARPGIDVVFIAMHGDFGESGRVQALCEQRGLRYVGSGPRASEIAMDKAAAKRTFKQAGLDTPQWVIIERFHSPDTCRRLLGQLPAAVVVKPVRGGSSIDVTIARDGSERDAAIEKVLGRHGRAMVERFVPGREVTVGVLGDRTLPVIEIVPAREFYDYAAKYDDDSDTTFVFDHGLDKAVVADLHTAAMTAHNALGCRDMSRVDFVLEDGICQVLEVNTIPGFTAHSLLPKAAQRAGISFEQLVDDLVCMALAHETLCADAG